MIFSSYDYIRKPLLEVNQKIERLFEQEFFPRATPLYKEGKRLRAALTLFTSYAFKEYDEDLIKVATAVELVHFSSLVHDDVVDEAEERRNEISLNKMVGNHAAVLIGDYVFSTAMHWIALTKNPLLFEEISRAVVFMCEGEMIEEFTKREDTFDEKFYFDLIYKKTGALFESSSMLGALYRGEKDKKFRNFGKKFGILYQILDDLIDFLQGEDIKQGKVTLPVIYAKEKIFQNFPEFKFRKDGFDEEKIKEIVIQEKGIEKSVERGRSLLLELWKVFDEFIPPLNRFLKEFTEEVYEYAISFIKN